MRTLCEVNVWCAKRHSHCNGADDEPVSTGRPQHPSRLSAFLSDQLGEMVGDGALLL